MTSLLGTDFALIAQRATSVASTATSATPDLPTHPSTSQATNPPVDMPERLGTSSPAATTPTTDAQLMGLTLGKAATSAPSTTASKTTSPIPTGATITATPVTGTPKGSGSGGVEQGPYVPSSTQTTTAPTAPAPAPKPKPKPAEKPVNLTGIKLPTNSEARTYVVAVLTHLANSSPTGRQQVEMLRLGHTTVTTAASGDNYYDPSLNLIKLRHNRGDDVDLDFSAEVLAHEAGHRFNDIHHLSTYLASRGISAPIAGLLDEVTAGAFAGVEARATGRPWTHPNLMHDFASIQTSGFYVPIYGFDSKDPATKAMLAKVPAAMAGFISNYTAAGIPAWYLTPGITNR